MPTMWQLLQVATFFFYLVPSGLCGNLRCFFRPILEKDYKLDPIVTECPPEEVCFKAEGRFGNFSALSAKGCLPKSVCSLEHDLSYKGVMYKMRYACCDRPYCNSCTGLVANTFVVTVTLVTVAVMVGS
ncbi:protein Bouncer isoform X1 [Syngnathoides biaculeatus]|uniref:protein Bouncer isoform X1 n=2 Tax=Syngnathoides biaculeatus TaxID=300417 RepID=UPI002ADD7B30|nr:protein Bouncer isoform X1 [Syngnathoides biaculeatus]